MIALEKARQYLEQLGLNHAAAVLESRLEAAAQKQLPYPDFLVNLLGIEAAARRERYLRTRTRLAHCHFTVPLSSSTSGFNRPSTSVRFVSWLRWLSSPTPPMRSSSDHHPLALRPPGIP